MSSQARNRYQPDSVTHPGSYIDEKLREVGMEQAELAARMGLPSDAVGEMIAGKARIGSAAAADLERIFGIPTRVWTKAERQYRESCR